jgi:hypothetical protein
MSNLYCNPSLTNVSFSNNSAETDGGGMYNYESNPVLINVILWGNIADSGGNQIYNNSSNPNISYSDIQGCGDSAAWDSNCGSNGGGNIDADPLFIDTENDNLRLDEGSPAIDAGNNNALPAGIWTDSAGFPRFWDVEAIPDNGNGTPPIVDMGAYEFFDGEVLFLPVVVR